MLNELLDLVTMPRKGKLSAKAKAVEQAPDFMAAKQAHSAVESAINGLEVHGLDKCLDYGIDGFKRYVATAVVARNIHRIGELVWRQAPRTQASQRERREMGGQTDDVPLRRAA